MGVIQVTVLAIVLPAYLMLRKFQIYAKPVPKIPRTRMEIKDEKVIEFLVVPNKKAKGNKMRAEHKT